MDEELKYLDSLSDLELVEYFQNGLVARATGYIFEEEFYKQARAKLISKSYLKDFIPEWIMTNRTVDQFWSFIKNKYGKYKERRRFLWDEFNPLLNFLEQRSISPVDSSIIFDEAHIHDQWQIALERKQTEPEAAITSARTLIECVLKHILDELKVEYDDGASLPDLYKVVAKNLNLAPELHNEKIFKQILGGTSSVVSGLGALRNKLGDAHGKSKRRVKPSARHSELAVNLAGSMAIFLFKTYKETKV